jgi:hypothetical protein
LASPPPACSVCANAAVGSSSPITAIADEYLRFRSVAAPLLAAPQKCLKALDPMTVPAEPLHMNATSSESMLAAKKKYTED